MAPEFYACVRSEDQPEASHLEKIADEAARHRGGSHAALIDSERFYRAAPLQCLTYYRFAVVE